MGQQKRALILIVLKKCYLASKFKINRGQTRPFKMRDSKSYVNMLMDNWSYQFIKRVIDSR
ncbi:hypothetical protein SXM_2462 [Shewanella xiamenensis]|nr:hypothetical protein SXM_2462 [Shewanella xiamenensis]BDQ65723.1 hypothetical protein NUITMVS2_15350 [Shewanella xiamenensis]